MVILPGCLCCGDGCGCEDGTRLPYTQTVTFEGLKNRTHSNHAPLSFEPSCIGSGAAGVAMTPGGDDEDKGPLTGVLLTNPGSGYARLGRVEPSLLIRGPGTGATFTPTFASVAPPSDCPCPLWRIASVAVSGDGEGYSDGGPLTVTLLNGTVQQEAATLVVRAERFAPETPPTASVAGGTGAVLSVSLTQQGSGESVSWGVSSVSVSSPGSGYADGAEVTFTPSPSTSTQTAAVAKIKTTVEEPTFSLVSVWSSTGTGAAATASTTQTPRWGGGPGWTVSGVTIDDGGTGYAEGDYLVFGTTDGQGQQDGAAYAVVSSVDEDGAIVAAEVDYSDVFWKDTGAIDSVEVENPGAYYKPGKPQSVDVQSGGVFYRESTEATPCVAEVTATVNAIYGGSGAVIRGEVDDDPESPTFGQLTGLTIEQAGTDYLAWRWTCAAHVGLNGLPFVLRASDPKKLVRLRLSSCFGEGATAEVDPIGDRVEPPVTLSIICPGDCDPGVVLTPTWASSTDEDGLTVFSIASVAASGGSGYENGQTISVVPNCPDTVLEAAEISATVDGDGALTGATVSNGGKYYLQLEWDGSPTGIKKVIVTSPGSGYARLGREEPTVSVTGSTSGQAATFEPTLAEDEDECGLPVWKVESISVSGGTEYVDGSSLTISGTDGASTERQAVAKVYTREEPTIEATVAGGGSGATLSVEVEKSTTAPPHLWKIKTVSVSNGGSGYASGAAVVFSKSSDVSEVSKAAAAVDVDEGGTVTSVSISNVGAYYRNRGIPQEVVVSNGGRYFKENETLPPHVADVEVSVSQEPPSDGSGVEFVVEVEDEVGHADFGKVKKITTSSDGSGYLPLGGPKDCLYTGGCGGDCSVGTPVVQLELLGPGRPVEVRLLDASGNPYSVSAYFRTTNFEGDCESLPSTASLFYGAAAGSATIASGGVWDSRGQQDCPPACDCVANPATEISWTSDCPCMNGQMGGQGTIGNIVGNPCSVNLDGFVYTFNPFVSIDCCDEEAECSEDEVCQYKWKIGVVGYVYDAANDSWGTMFPGDDEDCPTEHFHDYGGGGSCCKSGVTRDENGCLTGSITQAHIWFPSQLPPEGFINPNNCSVTVNFNGCP